MPIRDEDEISRLNNQKGVEGNKLLGYQSKMVEQGIDVSKAIPTLQEICCSLGVGYTVRSDEIKSMILKQESEEKTTKDRVRRLEKYINDQQDKVERYRNEEKDPFLNDRDRISKIMNAIRSVRTKINTMDQRLDTIDQGDKSIYDRDPEFYTPIWEYIGHRLGSVRDKGKEYSVRSVNLFAESKGLIIAEDGTEIHIGAMGTGEGQLSYIRGLLSNEDERMMIVLLDEVGNMSNSTIDFVKERLKCLQAEGKLMIGMMVRPGDVMEVTTFGL